ncbi:hypothetical protein [Ureibacillus sinduriensis]|uniref:Uncharacterized protein n=1 Tax=Ureibacillus sinduriensis BLB-1 = JCM 15800 TaxID=1384057 RepID=A0A0A3HQ63_9BACL|nr:hypothetical protein [Ureibacillus sinduriensis]KGR74716.1 hypothetical protein CD33_16700 [Ureibacillus sinduriensis BLB-1 = JCM 15800]
MRIQNQIIVEWTIAKHYDDVPFGERLGRVLKLQNELLKEGEALEIHQVTYIGEIDKEKVYIIILNIIPESV